MDKQKYNNYPLAISQILGLIEANDIAIPEIQRPFAALSNNPDAELFAVQTPAHLKSER